MIIFFAIIYLCLIQKLQHSMSIKNKVRRNVPIFDILSLQNLSEFQRNLILKIS